MGQGNDEELKSPSEIREAIAEARAEFGAHLNALTEPKLPSGGDGPGDEPMQAKQTAAKTTKGSKTIAKSGMKTELATKAPEKTLSKPKKKSTPARIAKGAAVQAAHALDTMAAGAVVGAVKAAAQAIHEKEAKGRQRPTSTGKVLGEIAPDAAMGALAGAAQAMMPEGIETKPTKKAAKPKAARKSH